MTPNEALVFLKIGGEITITTEAFINERRISDSMWGGTHRLEDSYGFLLTNKHMIISYNEYPGTWAHPDEHYDLNVYDKDAKLIDGWSWNETTTKHSLPLLLKGLVQ